MMLYCQQKKMESKDQTILELFHVKQSRNLIRRENAGIKTQEPDYYLNGLK